MTDEELRKKLDRYEDKTWNAGVSIAAVESLLDRLAIAEAAAGAMREALEFYADPDTYFAIGFMPDAPCGDFINDFEETGDGYKPGKKARAALESP